MGARHVVVRLCDAVLDRSCEVFDPLWHWRRAWHGRFFSRGEVAVRILGRVNRKTELPAESMFPCSERLQDAFGIRFHRFRKYEFFMVAAESIFNCPRQIFR